MNRSFLHYFIPHSETHKKAKLLSWQFLLIYILLFILLRTGFELTNIYKPGVLGINTDMTIQQVIAETNKERANRGLPPLKENSALSQAAQAKAKNMFEENYWAHFAPSGKDPWGFILGAGYKFTYAGENLARNYYTAGDVVKAWMNSPSHRDNLLNAKYQDIGIAVAEGTLQGQKTTLVVQMFGTTPGAAMAAAPSPTPQMDLGGQKVSVDADKVAESIPVSIAGSSAYGLNAVEKALIDPFMVTKVAGIIFIIMIGMLLVADYIILKRRGVFRISSHHFVHLSFLIILGVTLFLSKAGGIL